jgi:RNA polymerase sigma-70 factor (ECF subfamily)
MPAREPQTPFISFLRGPVETTGRSWPAGRSDHAHDTVIQLFDDCGERLRRYTETFGLSREESEDVVQDVFLALFRHVQLGRPADNLRGWLFRVAHNQALKQRQRRARRSLTEQALARADTEAVAEENPERQLADTEHHGRLRAVWRSLPTRDRRCVYLRAEGLRYRDIAKVMGMSLGGVANALARSIARLHREGRG